MHGFTGGANKNFVPWLVGELKAHGYSVQAPQLPNTDDPKESEQVPFVLKNVKFDENTVLIGHSLGGVVAMKVVEKLSHPINELVLIAPAIDEKHRTEAYLNSSKPKNFINHFDMTYSYEQIIKKTGSILLLSDEKESAIRGEYMSFLSDQLKATLLSTSAERTHFTDKQEPFILKNILNKITVFTTRPDTLFGATYMVLAPEHPLVAKITRKDQKKVVEDYIKKAIAKTDLDRQADTKEKTGVFTGAYAINPIDNKRIPIWISDYVLMGYGTGAIMAVPAHDERDWMFAKTFDLSVVRVINNDSTDDEYTEGEGTMVNSGEYDGLSSQQARELIVKDLTSSGLATEKINYKLRDWIFSRQHYWGEPIPIIHCDKDGLVPVPEDQLPLELPEVHRYEPTDPGESPLAKITDWVNVDCPKCGGPAKRETDTMPNWAGSSWYYLRYYDAHNEEFFADSSKLKYWGEVDLYLGGMEHTTLHLLYSRFWHQFLFDQKLVPTPEPYASRRGQGIILAEDGTKMSKSKGNVVNPTDIIEQGYGADALRLAITFLAPYDQTTPWNSDGVAGTFRFLQRFWTLVQEFISSEKTDYDNTELLVITNRAIKKVSSDLEKLYFNTAIATLMQTVNELYKLKASKGFSDFWKDILIDIAKLLAPFAPHITEEIWHNLGQDGSIHVSPWPVHDEKHIIRSTETIVVQVNGRVRGTISVANTASEQQIIELAKKEPKVIAYLKNKEVQRVIYVPHRLVNIVI